MTTVRLGILVTAATGAAQGALQTLGQGLTNLNNRVSTATRLHEQLGARVARVGAQGRPIGVLADSYVRLGRTIDAARQQAERLEATQERIAGHEAAAGELWGQAAGVVALGATLAAPLRAAINFESAFADVRKVVDGTDAELASLSSAIMGMARTLPLAHTEIAALAAAGGQLGVALQDLPAFVETTAKMAVAFDMTATEAGDAMAKVANVYQIPIAEIGRLGDAINQISNESPARASEIVRALSRVGGVASAFGLTANQAAALSGAFIAMGRTPEVAGTAINALLLRLQTASKQGPAFQAALESMGLSATGLSVAIGQDAQGALMGFLQALEKLPQAQRMGALIDMFGLEYADDVAVLAGNTALYAEQLDAATRSGGSMGREFEARSATTANNMRLLTNTLSELAINIGSVLLPPLNSLLSTLRPVIEAMAAWVQANPGVVAAIGKLVAGLLLFQAGSLAARAAFHAVSMGVLGVVSRVQTLRGAWLKASLAMQTASLAPMLGAAPPAAARLLGTLGEIATSGAPMRALGWHIAQIGARAKASALAVGGALKGALLGAGKALLWLGRLALLNPIGLALTAAALLVYKFWGPISGFFRGLWSGLVSGLAPIGASVREAFAPVMPALRPVLDVLARVGGWFRALIAPIEDTGGAAEAFGTQVGQAIAGAIRWFLGLPGQLLALPAEMLRLGAEIVNGLVNGIRQRLAAAGEAIRGVGASVRDTFRSVLGIRSPSTVFAEMGGNISDGLALGIQARLASVAQASAGLAAMAVTAFGGPALAAPALPEALQTIRQSVLTAPAPALPEALQTIRQSVLTAPAPALPEALQTIRQSVLTAPAPALPGGDRTVPDVPAGAAARPAQQGAMTVHYAPVLTLNATNAQAGAVQQEVQKALALGQAEFERMMRRYEAERQRRSVQ